MNSNAQPIAMQPNFAKGEAARYEQPAPGWKPRVQGKKFSYLRRKPAMHWNFRKHRAVHSKIPLQQLRLKGNAIGEMHPSLREKKRSTAWTVDVSDCVFKRTESTGHMLKRKAKALAHKVVHPGASEAKAQHKAAPLNQGLSMFSGAQAAQYEQPAAGWKPRVQGKKFSYLKRKPALQWHYHKRRVVHSKIPLNNLRLTRNAIGNLPLREKKHGIAWTVDVSDCVFKRKESTGHMLKRKAQAFVSAVKHLGQTKEAKPVGPAKHVRPEEQAIRKEHLTG